MHRVDELSDREARVLEAVIQHFIETAEPAGSQAVAKRCGLGVSAATVRNTMSDLEAEGYLYHTHTSSGRIPTDLAYRVYVSRLMRTEPPSPSVRARLENEVVAGGSTIEQILDRAARVLGVLTQELGVAVAPALDAAVLERMELARLSSDRLLVALTVQRNVVRTIFVEIPGVLASEVIESVSRILNERLAGLTLGEIRRTVRDRLRDAGPSARDVELLNVFVTQSDELFDLDPDGARVMLGSAQPLADQPEFATNTRMRDLLELTERRDVLRKALDQHRKRGLVITIGAENADPRLAEFTLVTSSYRHGSLSGVLGVLGPTRMPYDKIIGLVDHTSRLVEGLMQ
ncbi:MAG: heat-inducible transcriptional repressor HrcA [Gemmatimonadales bacterium]